MQNHKPRKRFGQNFLIDNNIIEKIVTAINPSAEDFILEIGPGLGALTKHLLASNANVSAVEIDNDLSAQLLAKYNTCNNFTLYQEDFLKFDLATLGNHKLKVVGNLPYNISTPILFKIFEALDKISEIYIMVQLEVAERLLASPHCKEYGRLSVMAQYFCDIELMLHVPNTAFNPAPKVKSAIVRCIPKVNFNLGVNLTTLRLVTTAAFNMRRKVISNSLKTIISNEQLLSLNINPQMRAENLSVQDFVNITNLVNGVS
jgi:16S rRNA (adenine1518-N6/adenine1519-N6)-dimethyltransferase